MLFRAKFARGLLSGDYSKSAENAVSTVSFHLILISCLRIVVISMIAFCVVLPFLCTVCLICTANVPRMHCHLLYLLQSVPVGIRPEMFKTLVGSGHREFSTKQQQDAHEFLLHLLTLIDVSQIYVTQ